MDLPAPLSCFNRGFARPTFSLANSIICACEIYVEQKTGLAGVGATALMQQLNATDLQNAYVPPFC